MDTFPGYCDYLYCSKRLLHTPYERKGRLFCDKECANKWEELDERLNKAADPFYLSKKHRKR